MKITHFNIFNFQGALEGRGDYADSVFGFFNSRNDYAIVEDLLEDAARTWEYATDNKNGHYREWLEKNGIIKHTYGIEELILLGPHDLTYLQDHPDRLNLIVVSIQTDEKDAAGRDSYLLSYGAIKEHLKGKHPYSYDDSFV